MPEGLIPGGDCPAAGPKADEEISAQASALVPLREGLTLATAWKPNPEEEFECLRQVTTIDRDGIEFTSSCDNRHDGVTARRRVCRSDLRDARILLTEIDYGITVIDASGEDLPYVMVGATAFSLSSRGFAELKRTGTTRHHYVQFGMRGGREQIGLEVVGVLRVEGAGTMQAVVNNGPIEVPVIRASGEAEVLTRDRTEKRRIRAVILDDERFPLLLDYLHAAEADGSTEFRVNFATISVPASAGDEGRPGSPREGLLGGGGSGAGVPAEGSAREMERALAVERRVDVYGIYFDFASDRIRKESEPVLREIAGMLSRNPDWTLSIDGHTDNIGGDAYNLDLSRRRSAAVRKALVDRFGIPADRLATAGHGASAPKDTNDTPEGRARNRRVELVRR